MMRRTAIRFVRAQARNARPVISASPLPSVDPAKHSLWFLAILSLLMGFGSISTDLYLPAMPAMKLALHAKPGAIELTISGYLMGFSLGQLAWGPISDRYGRRIPIALGLMLFVLGSAGCALSTSASLLIGCRIVQALGACASVVLARAMVRDLYSGSRARSRSSRPTRYVRENVLSAGDFALRWRHRSSGRAGPAARSGHELGRKRTGARPSCSASRQRARTHAVRGSENRNSVGSAGAACRGHCTRLSALSIPTGCKI